MKSNLDESVLCNEFNVLVKAPKYASHGTSDNFIESSIFSSHGFVFMSQIFENNSDHGDDSNTESSKGNRSTMEPSSPVNSFDQANTLSSVVSLSIEIPHASHGSNDELLKANEESNNPQKSKQEVPSDVCCLLIIGNKCNWKFINVFHLSDTI